MLITNTSSALRQRYRRTRKQQITEDCKYASEYASEAWTIANTRRASARQAADFKIDRASVDASSLHEANRIHLSIRVEGVRFVCTLTCDGAIWPSVRSRGCVRHHLARESRHGMAVTSPRGFRAATLPALSHHTPCCEQCACCVVVALSSRTGEASSEDGEPSKGLCLVRSAQDTLCKGYLGQIVAYLDIAYRGELPFRKYQDLRCTQNGTTRVEHS